MIKGNFSCPGNAGELGLWRAWLCSSTSAKNYRKTGKFGQTTLYNYNQSRLLYSTKTLRFLVIAHWWVCLSGGFFHPSVSSLNIIAF